jgi:hypothetical protein
MGVIRAVGGRRRVVRNHTIKGSVFLFAFCRYIAVDMAHTEKSWCNQRLNVTRAKCFIVVVSFVPLALTLMGTLLLMWLLPESTPANAACTITAVHIETLDCDTHVEIDVDVCSDKICIKDSRISKTLRGTTENAAVRRRIMGDFYVGRRAPCWLDHQHAIEWHGDNPHVNYSASVATSWMLAIIPAVFSIALFLTAD